MGTHTLPLLNHWGVAACLPRFGVVALCKHASLGILVAPVVAVKSCIAQLGFCPPKGLLPRSVRASAPRLAQLPSLLHHTPQLLLSLVRWGHATEGAQGTAPHTTLAHPSCLPHQQAPSAADVWHQKTAAGRSNRWQAAGSGSSNRLQAAGTGSSNRWQAAGRVQH